MNWFRLLRLQALISLCNSTMSNRNPNPNSYSLSNAPKDMKKCSFDNLPNELFRKIMVLLPVESLIRCKCLNKSWYSDICYLIKAPKFVANNICFAKAFPTTLLFCEHGSPPVASMHHVQLTDNGNAFGEIQCVTQDFSFPRSFDRFYTKAFRHCNGLICFSYDYKVITTGNPALCEYETLEPKTGVPEEDLSILGMGFGCDSEARNYKVLRLLINMKAQVFTLGSAYSWRTFRVSIKKEEHWDLDGQYAYSSGRCFWLMRKRPENTVLCFNFSTDFPYHIFGSKCPKHPMGLNRTQRLCSNDSV